MRSSALYRRSTWLFLFLNGFVFTVNSAPQRPGSWTSNGDENFDGASVVDIAGFSDEYHPYVDTFEDEFEFSLVGNPSTPEEDKIAMSLEKPSDTRPQTPKTSKAAISKPQKASASDLQVVDPLVNSISVPPCGPKKAFCYSYIPSWLDTQGIARERFIPCMYILHGTISVHKRLEF